MFCDPDKLEKNLKDKSGKKVTIALKQLIHINPEQFDEPDEDALEEMQELLEQAAESQGLTYEE